MIKILNINDKENESILSKILNRNSINDDKIAKLVEDIVNDIRLNGDKALLNYTEKFDKVLLSPSSMIVSKEEIENAYLKVEKDFLNVIQKSIQNVRAFHEKQKEKSWFSTQEEGIMLGQLINPIENVGVYVPGGTAAYPSSVIMNVVPAKIAGVKNIYMATPPKDNGVINPYILVAANEAGVDTIYKMGGAQAVAAFAFGTSTVKKVDKIVGPGNIFVATAKKFVYGTCDIDMIAGPSEITILADDTAKPEFVAADLLSQAEHDKLASAILVTNSDTLAKKVAEQIAVQTNQLERKDIIEESLNNNSAIIVVDNLEQGIELTNRIAPEHFELCVDNPLEYLGKIKNAGAVFIGNYSSEPLGDYLAGPNHVLPTSGTARFFSPLSVDVFMKKSSLIYYSKTALSSVKDDIVLFASKEGLDAHANAIKVRFN